MGQPSDPSHDHHVQVVRTAPAARDRARATAGPRAFRLGIGGPVGSGKTALVAALCRVLAGELTIAVVTNDIYTTEDADFLRDAGVLEPHRIVAVETGCCPHTAVRDDITANLDAVERLEAQLSPLDLVLVESGGDKVPRKGGPGVRASDLLVVNKTDLAPLVGADLAVMARDASRVRRGAPVLFTSLRQGTGVAAIAAWVGGRRGAWAGTRG